MFSVTLTYIASSLIVDGDASDQTIEVTRPAGTTFYVYENGVLVGTESRGVIVFALHGGAGNDVLKAYDGAVGTTGVVTYNGNEGNDTIYGTSHVDDIYGSDGADLIYCGSNNDSVNGELGNDTIYGEDGNDFLQGGNNNDYIVGGDGDDTLQGNNHGDEIYGGLGNDSIVGGSGSDYMYGNEGHDVIDAIDSEIDYGTGGPDTDTINKDANDSITG